jgi:hypothetical protein
MVHRNGDTPRQRLVSRQQQELTLFPNLDTLNLTLIAKVS